ncbi:TPA: hypothetical protein ACIS41_001381, partial [Salmonella enterica subsp. diarizonae serovar 50:k:z35]
YYQKYLASCLLCDKDCAYPLIVNVDRQKSVANIDRFMHRKPPFGSHLVLPIIVINNAGK